MHKNNDKFHTHSTKIAILENKHLYINETLLRIEKRLDKMDERFDKIDEKFERLERKMESGFKESKSDLVRLETKVDSHFKWILTTLVITVGSLAISSSLTYLSKMYHWIT